MRVINVNTDKPYEVIIGSGLIEHAGEIIKKSYNGKTAFLVSDDSVFALYGERVVTSLEESGINVLTFIIPHGEESKSFKNYRSLVEYLTDANIGRDDICVALGGGVVGDLTGFAAATFKRGLDFVQIPTTLLSAVDSSVGGKTGINVGKAKNQVGAFHQPALVICDTSTLRTLDYDEFRNGLGEVIKYAMIGGSEFFAKVNLLTEVKKEWTPSAFSDEEVEELISSCVRIKADLVEKDEFDRGERALLNLGHTAGHAIETLTDFDIPHGQAVAIGMAMITRAAVAKGICKKETALNLEKLLKSAGLLAECPLRCTEISEAVLTDKKITSRGLNLIVPVEAGKCEIIEVSKDDIEEWMRFGSAEDGK